MEVLVENTSTLGRRLKVSVPHATVQEQIKNKITRLAKEVRLKGYSPGRQIPHSVIQNRFGKSIRAEVINDLIHESLTGFIKEKQLQPAGSPQIEEIKDESGESLQFTASFEIYPEIKLADISDVEIEKRKVDVKDEDVKNMVEKLQDQLANWDEVNRTVQNGDKLTVDFARLLNEQGAKREEQPNVQMVVGDKGVLPGLTEALIGKQKGEQIEINIRYPDDWSDQRVAGKEGTLWVTIHQITEKKALSTDELIKKLNLEEPTLEKLHENVRQRMTEEVEAALQEELKEKILEKLIEKNPLELPQALINQEKAAINREAARQGSEALDPEEIDFQAKRRVELGLLLNEVIQKHNIRPDLQRVRAQIEKIVGRFGKSAELTDAYMANKDLRQGVERMVLLDQAVEVLSQEVKLVEKTVSFNEVMNQTEENQ